MPNATALALRSPGGLWNIGLPRPGVFYDEPAPASESLVPVSVPQVPSMVLKLSDDRRIAVNGQNATLPVGVGRLVRVDALKVLLGIYRGMTLYKGTDGLARRLRDDEVIEVSDGQGFGARQEMPQVTSVPRNLTRD